MMGCFEPMQEGLGCFRLRAQYERSHGSDNMWGRVGNCQQLMAAV